MQLETTNLDTKQKQQNKMGAAIVIALIVGLGGAGFYLYNHPEIFSKKQDQNVVKPPNNKANDDAPQTPEQPNSPCNGGTSLKEILDCQYWKMTHPPPLSTVASGVNPDGTSRGSNTYVKDIGGGRGGSW